MEVLVVTAVVAVLIALLVPAVQKVREMTVRAACQERLRQLAFALDHYRDANDTFPYGRRYDIWDSYTWTSHVLPYVGETSVYAGFWTMFTYPYSTNYPGANGPIGDEGRLRAARHAILPVFYCPADVGPMGNELNTGPFGFYRNNYRGCSGTGDMYGKPTDATGGPWGIGVFGVLQGQSDDPGASIRTLRTQSSDVVDGLSNTLLLSEGLVPTVTNWGGPLGETFYGNMGGGIFSSSLTPNSSAPDGVCGPCPRDCGDQYYRAPCQVACPAGWWTPSGLGGHSAARSNHFAGVNAAFADGSTRFVTNDVDLSVWRALGTRSGGELNNLP